MSNPLESQFQAAKLVHWPTGLTYACDCHAQALQKIASSMRLHISRGYILASKITLAMTSNVPIASTRTL